MDRLREREPLVSTPAEIETRGAILGMIFADLVPGFGPCESGEWFLDLRPLLEQMTIHPRPWGKYGQTTIVHPEQTG